MVVGDEIRVGVDVERSRCPRGGGLRCCTKSVGAPRSGGKLEEARVKEA